MVSSMSGAPITIRQQVSYFLSMILKDKTSAENVKKSCATLMNEKGKELLVHYFESNVWRLSFFEKMDFDALADSLLKHFESKLDCEEYFAMYQKVLASNKKASAAFFRGDMERALTLLAKDGDQSQLASALADNFRLSAAIFKIGFNLFSEAPKDAIVMLSDYIAKNVPTKTMMSGGPFGFFTEEEYTQFQKAWKLPLNRNALQSFCSLAMKKYEEVQERRKSEREV